MSLDLAEIETEAKHQLRPVNDGTPKRLHLLILRLIDEIRVTRGQLLIANGVSSAKSATLKAYKGTAQRLKEVEEILQYYAHPDHYEPWESMAGSHGPGVLVGKGDKARAYFEKWVEK